MGIGLPEEASSCTASVTSLGEPAPIAGSGARGCQVPNLPARQQPPGQPETEPVSGEQTAAANSGREEAGSFSDGPANRPAASAQHPPLRQLPPRLPPKLGDILTPDEQKQYNAAIDQSLSHAQTSLNSIAGRQLNKDQQAEVEQIRNFMQQAQATRDSDPAGAKSLAERAEVLARDLAATFR